MKSKIMLIVALLGALAHSAVAQTFTEEHEIVCGDTVYIGNLAHPTWAIANIEERPNFGHAILLGDFVPANLLQYTSPYGYAGTDTVVISCARATQTTCDTGIYIFTMSCPENIQPIYTQALRCNDSVRIDGLSGWSLPEIVAGPDHGEARLEFPGTDAVYLHYRPEPGFEGLDFVRVALSGAIGNDTALYIFQVYCDFSTATDEVASEAKWLLYPNPTEGILYVSTQEPLHELGVWDAQGRAMRVPMSAQGEGYQLQLDKLPAGLYILWCRTDEGVKWRRFVKK